MAKRLNRMASERERQSAELRGLRLEVIDCEQEIMSLQYEVSWAAEGAAGEGARPREKSIDWMDEMRKSLAEADDVVREKGPPGVSCDTEPAPSTGVPLRASAPA